jgi:hypothetical protein
VFGSLAAHHDAEKYDVIEAGRSRMKLMNAVQKIQIEKE